MSTERASDAFDDWIPNDPTLVAQILYYGATMNAFEVAENEGRGENLRRDLNALFESQNASPHKGATSIPAAFLRVTVT